MPDKVYTENKEENKKYKKLLSEKGYARDSEFAKLHLPELEDEDYVRGSFFRYFCRQRNSITAPILEIDKEQYESWHSPDSGLDKQFYIVCAVRWRISGELQGYEADDNTYRKGVLEGNRDSLLLADEKIPGISDVIQDYIKFWSK